MIVKGVHLIAQNEVLTELIINQIILNNLDKNGKSKPDHRIY